MIYCAIAHIHHKVNHVCVTKPFLNFIVITSSTTMSGSSTVILRQLLHGDEFATCVVNVMRERVNCDIYHSDLSSPCIRVSYNIASPR